MSVVPTIINRPQRYETGADEESRSQILAVIEAFAPDLQLAVACGFTLIALRGMRDASPGPAQRRMCQTHIDIIEPLIPPMIRDVFAKAAK